MTAAESIKRLASDTVVDLLRQRMRIEQSFPHFKTRQGLRGLQLEVRLAPRLGRPTLAFTLAYAPAVAVGGSEQAQPSREQLECPAASSRAALRRLIRLANRTRGAPRSPGACSRGGRQAGRRH